MVISQHEFFGPDQVSDVLATFEGTVTAVKRWHESIGVENRDTTDFETRTGLRIPACLSNRVLPSIPA